MVRQRITKKTKARASMIRRRAKNGKANFEILIRKTSQHIYANIIDLVKGNTINTFSSINVSSKDKKISNRDASSLVGKDAAKYCKEKNINPAINIGGHKFHGLVKELADSFTSNIKN